MVKVSLKILEFHLKEEIILNLGIEQVFAQFLVWAISLYVLYLVIRSAIDSSETAQNLREIKRILSLQSNDSKEMEKENQVGCEMLDVSFDKCPACYSKVSQKDKECPSCGLALKNMEE
jgi:hypothetical protein